MDESHHRIFGEVSCNPDGRVGHDERDDDRSSSSLLRIVAFVAVETMLVSVSSVAALVRHKSGRTRCDGVTRGGGAGGWEAPA
jgi:hypothetical protein